MKKSSDLQFSIFNFQFSIFLLIVFTTSSVFAHSIDVFATVEGKNIQGRANYHDGTPVKNSDVAAFDPSGKEIGRTKSDDEGRFILEARFRCDHRLLVDAGDGHGGEYTISAKLLPADLPPLGASAVSANSTRSHSEADPQHQHEQQADAETAEKNPQQALLMKIHADIDALQDQLDQYEHRTRFRDILGGIGYIVGLVGAAYAYYYRGLLKKIGKNGNN